jgi:ribulose 1,5-bisphosphate synthetase/thiazole synthase
MGKRPEKLVNEDETMRFPDTTLPVLRRADAVVVGGGFAGVAAALRLAHAGREVVLVEPRTYLGREITATLRPWVRRSAVEGNAGSLEVLAACVKATLAAPNLDEIPLKLDAVKLTLEDLLLAAGVELLYASLPMGTVQEERTVRGLIIGNKSGRQVLTCDVIVDATAASTVARVSGAVFEAESAVSRYGRTLEFEGVRKIPDLSLSVPHHLGVVEDTIALHLGYRGEGHVLVEASMDLPGDGVDLAGWMQREIEARHRTMRLASYLIRNVDAFRYARLATASYELHGRRTSRMVGDPPGWAVDFSQVDVSFGLDGEVLETSLDAFAGPVQQLWCLNEAARLNPRGLKHLQDPVWASLVGDTVVECIASAYGGTGVGRSSGAAKELAAKTPSLALELRELDGPQRGRAYERRSIPAREVPIMRSTDVLVVGGGTSGATAAITSALEGMQTVLLDMNPELGGTGTLGGVDSYWFGRRVAFAARVTELVEAVHDSLDYEGRKWNIEAKQYALLREAQRAGAEIFWNSVVVGAIVEAKRVRGVIAASRFGPIAVLADVVIDATGDGDVAAFAGAEFVYGNAQDHVTMWYSLAQFVDPGRSQNNFTSMVDVSNIEDYTRAILAGRRRGGDCHDHGVYVAPRESRHIVGDETLTLTDQLLHRRWPDAVNIHFSNHDIKGHSGADWLRQGLIPPNLEVEIPYRALLPKGLEGILVTGKALSATHDALPAIRMQADLENLGGAVATAAAQAIKDGVTPRRINVPELQSRLVARGLLPENILNRTLEADDYTEAELHALVQALDADRPLYADSDMEMDEVFRERIPFVEICAAGARVAPALEQALASAPDARRVRLAQALAMVGSQAGVPTLIDQIQRYLVDGVLPARESHIRHTQLPPDQGAMPEVVYLIYALGMAQDRRSLAVWERVEELLEPTGENLRDRLKGVFYYVDAVCFGAERLGDPAAIPILEKMHNHATLQGQITRDGFQPDYFLERQAMLELAIGRALARCGSRKGLKILIAFLQDNRALLAQQAHTALVTITGTDFGMDFSAWEDGWKKCKRLRDKDRCQQRERAVQ